MVNKHHPQQLNGDNGNSQSSRGWSNGEALALKFTDDTSLQSNRRANLKFFRSDEIVTKNPQLQLQEEDNCHHHHCRNSITPHIHLGSIPSRGLGDKPE